MPKTYYLGQTKTGAYVARASGSDYGYTHAATYSTAGKGELVPMSSANFSKSADGARKLAQQYNKTAAPEVVALTKVDRATYKAATGKA